MKYLFFTHTPAQVHEYRRAVARLRDRGHDVLVLARADGRTEALLDSYDLPYALLGSADAGGLPLVPELPKHFVRAAVTARRFDPNGVFGRSAYAALAGTVARAPVVLLAGSDDGGLGLTAAVPFADAVLTPHTVERNFGETHYEFRGVTELAYLHPDGFEPRPEVRDDLGVGEEDFAVVRFEGVGSRRTAARGLSPAKFRQFVDSLSEHATVFVAGADDLDLDGSPARRLDLHPPSKLDGPTSQVDGPTSRLDALAEASLVVADSRRTVTEAALLGTPAIHSNAAGSNLVELERHGLAHDLREFHDVLDTATDLLAADAEETWAERRDDYLSDAVNPTDVLLDVAETIPRFGIGHVEGVASRNLNSDPDPGLGPDSDPDTGPDPDRDRAVPFDPGAVRNDGGKP